MVKYDVGTHLITTKLLIVRLFSERMDGATYVCFSQS